MKIAMVAPVWERVPPTKYGGIELVVHLLTEELVRRGHDVTLFATGDSITEARLEFVFDVSQRKWIHSIEPDLLHASFAYHRIREEGDYEIIHNHTGYSGVALADFVDVPVLTTLHGIFTEVNRPFFKFFKDVCYYNSISKEQRRGLPELNYIATVYNAINVKSYPFREKKEDFFLWLSRVSPLKGAHYAVRIAREAGIKLVMAGKIDEVDRYYYEHDVRPFIDGKQVEFLGEVSEEEKRELMGKARAFIFPITWSEPFGLVMIEAMACGTPVLATGRGAVPEVVKDGETGFIVKKPMEIVDKIKKVDEISPQACRKHVEERFSEERMARDYEEVYLKIIEAERKG